MKYQILMLILMFFGKCNSQNKELLEINIEQYTIQVEIESSYSISIQQGFDSKIYRAISKSQETLVELEVGFTVSNLIYSKEDFQKEISDNEVLNIPKNNLKIVYETNKNSFRSISGKAFHPTVNGFLNCLNFEVSEQEFQKLITILNNIQIKKQ